VRTHGMILKTISTLAVFAMLAGTLSTPAPVWAKDKKNSSASILAWPPPPEIARVKFIANYRGDDIKGIHKKGILERLAGVEERTSRSVLQKPFGIAVDSKGLVYVTDSMLGVVFVFDLEKKILEYRGDKPPAQLTKPSGVAVDAQDRLFVADSANQNITVFDAAGEVESVFGKEQLQRPAGIAIDNELGRVYVADAKARKVAQFDLKTLKFQRWIGKSWEEKVKPEEYDLVMNAPVSVAVDGDGLLYVVDAFLNRVTVFDPDGEFVRHIGNIGQGPGHFMRPKGVAVDGDGHIYVTDAMANSFQIVTQDGAPLMPIGGMGSAQGRFMVPAAITVDKFNRIIVADQGNHRIQIFRYVTDEEAATERSKRQQAQLK
jgi:DNA-binding beta-propeller fold protein YncE